MKFNELNLTRQSQSSRVGRGIAAGKGKTAGRGTKGQGSRKSGGVRPGFEGGQMPLYMRLPKLRGFKSLRTKPAVIQLQQLNTISQIRIDGEALAKAGLISNPTQPVKLLAGGELKSKKEVHLTAASDAAIAALEKAGGSFTAVGPIHRPKKTP